MSRGKAYKPENNSGWWRDVVGYDGKYQVSRLGEIRRVYRADLVCDMTPFKRKNKITRNRLFVKLTRNGKGKDEPLLQIVAAAWLGKTPAGKVPYHINGIVTDNRVDNIAFIDRKTLGRITGSMAEKRKIVMKIDEAGNVVEIYRSAREAAKANFMSYQTVLDRCHNIIKQPFKLNGFSFCFEDSRKGARSCRKESQTSAR